MHRFGLAVFTLGLLYFIAFSCKGQNAAKIAQQYQMQRAIKGQVNLSPATQKIQLDQIATVTASCARFRCTNYQIYWGDDTQNGSKTGEASHRYAKPGSYTVYAKATISRNYMVISNVATVAVITPQIYVVTLNADPPNAILGRGITFTASLEPAEPGAHYNFQFGNDATQETLDSRIVYTYPATGDYQAQVQVTDARGKVLAISSAYPISIVNEQPPQLRVHVTPGLRVEAGTAFTVQATVNPAVDGIKYEFHWEDGMQDEIAFPDGSIVHTFDRPGTHSVQVTGLTQKTFAQPIETSFSMEVTPPPISPNQIPTPPQPPSYWWYVLGAIALLGGGLATKKILFPGGLKLVPTPSKGSHTVRLTGGPYPQVSFCEETGLRDAMHRVIPGPIKKSDANAIGKKEEQNA